MFGYYLRVYCCVLKCLLHIPPLRQMNLVHTIPYWLFEIHFNIIQSAPWSSEWSLRGLGDTQRQAQALISGPCLGAKARFLSFNRTQSRAVTGFLTGHNTLRRCLHLLGLLDSPLCRRCGTEEETSVHIRCECEALASIRHAYLGSFLESEDIKSISLGAIWNFSKATGLL